MGSLNEQQLEAVEHMDGPCVVVSVPGSGKTRVLTTRTAKMIEKGVPENKIVCLTFTNKAADEMKERLRGILGKSSLKCFVGTFHSFCVLLLRKFAHLAGYSSNFTIMDSDEQIDLISQIARQQGKKIEKAEARDIAKAVNNMRENIQERDELEKSLNNDDFLILVADLYLESLKQNNVIDFSGLLFESINILEENPDVLDRVRRAIDYISVDEVQDTNISQFYFLNLIGKPKNNIFLVGDPSQSVYRFRGARIKNVMDFINNNKDCKIINLSLNYRSTPQIVKAADSLIRNNQSHMADKFETGNESGENVFVMGFENQMNESRFVANQIERLIHYGGWNPGDIAVLYRINSMSEPVERALSNKQINYEVIGGRSFYDRKEVKDSLAMLRFLSNPKDGIAFHRIARLVPGMGDVTIGMIENESKNTGKTILEFCSEFSNNHSSKNIRSACRIIHDRLNIDISNKNAAECLDSLVKRMGYESYLEKYYKDDYLDRMSNIKGLIDSAANFAEDRKTDSIDEYLQMVALMTSSDKDSEEDRVSLMTIHASKGLEFPIVFMVGVEENIMPHAMSLYDGSIESIEEERRVGYVAMTRAKNMLYMTYCNERIQFSRGPSKGSFRKKCKPSRFLYESKLLKKNSAV